MLEPLILFFLKKNRKLYIGTTITILMPDFYDIHILTGTLIITKLILELSKGLNYPKSKTSLLSDIKKVNPNEI